MFLTDPRNPKAVALEHALRARLPSGLSTEPWLVLGGDGFMLKCVAEQGLDRPFLGLNCGYLGFLMNTVEADLDQLVARICAAEWRPIRFPLLEATIHCSDGTTLTRRAINDVVLQRESGHASRLRLSVDGRQVVDSLGGDGLVVATALGSTAYSFSAGGTPLHPTLRALLVTPICPHRPRLSPVCLPADSRVSVEVVDAERRPVGASTDGQLVATVSGVDVRYGEDEVTLVWFPDHDFTGHLVDKILLP